MGKVNAILYIFSRLLCRVSQGISLNRYYIFAFPAKEKGGENFRFCAPYTFRLITNSVELEQDRLSQYEIRNRLDAGDKCFACFKNNILVAYLWINRSGYKEINDKSFFELDDDGLVWDYDIFVLPEFRSGFAFGCIWNEYIKYLKKQDVKYSLSRVSVFNYQSIRSHKSLGAEVLFSVAYLRVYRCQISLSTVFPYVYISVGHGMMPRFGLDRILVEKGFEF